MLGPAGPKLAALCLSRRASAVAAAAGAARTSVTGRRGQMQQGNARRQIMAAADPIWTRTKQPWITFAEGEETFEGQPPG